MIFFIFILFFLFLNSNFVFSKTLTDYFYSGEPISFHGKTYYGYIGKDTSSLLLTSKDFSSLISLGKCEEHDFVEFCFLDVETKDYNKVKIDSNGNFIYPFKLSFKTTGPDVDVSLNFDKSTLDVGGITKGTLSVKNNGNREAENIFLKVYYNNSLKFLKCDSCVLGYDVKGYYFVVKPGLLNVNETKSYDLKVKLLKPEDSNFTAFYNYSYKESSADKREKIFSIKSFKPYTLSLNYAPSVSIGDFSEESFIVKNEGNKELYVNISVKKNSILNYYDLEDDYSFVLKPKSEKKIVFKVRSLESKTYTTKFNFSFFYEGKKYFVEKNMKISFKSSNLDVIYTFDKERVVSGEKGTFYLSIKNNNEDIFKNINVSVKGFFNDSKNYSLLNPDTVLKVFDVNIVYPEVDVPKTFYENITLKYHTVYGEEKIVEKNLKINVFPLNKSYSLKVLKSKKFDENNNTFFEFKILGNSNVDSKISVKKIFSKIKNLKLLAGILNNSNVVVERKEKTLYGFTAKNLSENFYVNTTAEVEYKKNNEKEKVNISFFLFKGNLSLLNSKKDSKKLLEEKDNVKNITEENAQDNEKNLKNKNVVKKNSKINNKKEKTFFSVIIDFFKDLFTL